MTIFFVDILYADNLFYQNGAPGRKVMVHLWPLKMQRGFILTPLRLREKQNIFQ